jgi:hypothetical protein
MVADSDSNIAWHRVQLKKNRAELKALETARFTMGEIASSKRNGQTQKAIAELKRKPQQWQLEQLGRLYQSAQGRAALARTRVGSFRKIPFVARAGFRPLRERPRAPSG